MKRIAILGAGAWGTALSIALAARFPSISLWVHDPELADRVSASRRNDTFLAGHPIPANVLVTSQLQGALTDAELVLGVMPSHAARSVYGRVREFIPAHAPIVSASKGLEAGSLHRMSQVIGDVLGPNHPVVALSGPSFASEVAAGKPTALVAASHDRDLARLVQTRFSGATLRVYASEDPVGVEIGGALKNVIAIGAGMCDGLGLGHNAVAALITRGLAELVRLATVFGASRDTLSGLAGLGDLVLTCTGDLSRNRQVGLQLAAGLALGTITASTPAVAEGVRTASVAIEMAARFGVEMPISQEVYAVLHQGRSPADAVVSLMGRSPKAEWE